MTHSELVDLTAKKAHTLFKCGLVLREMSSRNLGFFPDVFAVKKTGLSFQFEVKVSLSDFLHDKDKLHRKVQDQDVGAYRYFVVPKGLIKSGAEHNDIKNHQSANWGLIEVTDGGKFIITRGLDPKNGLTQFDDFTNPFYNRSNSKAELELVYSYYQKLVNQTKINGSVKVDPIAEKYASTFKL